MNAHESPSSKEKNGNGKTWEKLGPILAGSKTSDQNQKGDGSDLAKAKDKAGVNKNTDKQPKATQNSQGTDVSAEEDIEEEKGVHEISGGSENEDESEREKESESESENEIASENEREKGKTKKKGNQSMNGNLHEQENDGQYERERIEREKDDCVSANKDLSENENERQMDARTNSDDQNSKPTVPNTSENPENTNTVSVEQKTSNEENEEEESEVYIDAVENTDKEIESDQSLEVVDEYIELKTTGAKILESLTPRTRKKREKQKQDQAGLSESRPIILEDSQSERTSSNCEKEKDKNIGPTTNEQATDNASQPIQSATRKFNAASEPQPASQSVGTSGDDVTVADQPGCSLQDKINAANNLASERERIGLPINETESKQQQATTSTGAAPTPNKTKQTKLTLGGRILKPDTDEENEVSDSEKGAGGAKNKPKPKGKGKGKDKRKKKGNPNPNSNSNPNTPSKTTNLNERKLRSQSSSQQ